MAPPLEFPATPGLDRPHFADLAQRASHLPFVLIATKARTPEGAIDTSLRAFDLVRALWNYSLNRTLYETWPPRDDRPLSSILRGPLYTVHLPSGALAFDEYGYDAAGSVPPLLQISTQEWLRVRREEGQIRKVLTKHPYRPELEGCFRRYGEALDQVTMEATFLRLWSLLEYLTRAGSEHEKVVKRAAAIYEDSDYHRLVLQHLRAYRNGAVHAGLVRSEAQPLAIQLKRVVENMLHLHLNARRLRSMDEVAELLDLPLEARALRALRRENRRECARRDGLLVQAIRFRRS